VRIPLRPCLGTIGVAPAGDGVSTIMPGDHGGNLDSRDVGSGTTVYLPVQVAGAGFGLGDPKAAMGDGEVCGTGIGVASRVEATFRVVRDVPLRRPVLETDDEWMAVASAPTLDEAARIAVDDMVALITRVTGDRPEHAYMLLSVAGHLRVSQVVDPWMTARMTIGKAFVPGLLARA
jgi:amidase